MDGQMEEGQSIAPPRRSPPLQTHPPVPLRITLVPVDVMARSLVAEPGIKAAVDKVQSLLVVNSPLLSPAREWGVGSMGPCFGPGTYIPDFAHDLRPGEEGEIKLALVGNYTGETCTGGGGGRLAFASTCAVHTGDGASEFHSREVVAGFIVLCPRLLWGFRDLIYGTVMHEIFHSLGFQKLPNSDPGKGKATVAEARRLLGCDNIDSVPCDAGGPHWAPVLIGSDEIMTPCVSDSKKVYVSSLTVAVMVDTGRFSSRQPLDSPSAWEWRGTSGCGHLNTTCVGDPELCRQCGTGDFDLEDWDPTEWDGQTWIYSIASGFGSFFLCLCMGCCAICIRNRMEVRPSGATPDLEQHGNLEPYGALIGVVCFELDPSRTTTLLEPKLERPQPAGGERGGTTAAPAGPVAPYRDASGSHIPTWGLFGARTDGLEQYWA